MDVALEAARQNRQMVARDWLTATLVQVHKWSAALGA